MLLPERAVEQAAAKRIHYVLQVAIAMCFIGHGAFGIITKQIWCNYFGVFGIGPITSYKLMPLVGVADILLGVLMLIRPMRAIAGWLVIWGLLTAVLRPLSGEPFAEFIERAGNYGAPLALLLLSGGLPTARGQWFKKMKPELYPPVNATQLFWCLRIVAFLLLSGHGWLNIIEKQGLLKQYVALGWGDGRIAALLAGSIELFFACAILIKPIRQLVLVVLVWKLASEMIYLQYPFFEWVERGGSYGTVLCIWLMLRSTVSANALRTEAGFRPAF